MQVQQPITAEHPDSARESLEARLVDAVQQAVIATDVAGRVIFWNAYAERLFGWSAGEALGRSIVDLTPHESTRDEAIAIMERLRSGQSWAGEFQVRRKDGSTFVAFVVNSPLLDSSGTLMGIVGVSTDVSEQRALEAQLRQATKMEAVGRLAGGVAHDFNNLLTVILGNVDVLLRQTDAPRAVDSLNEVRDAAARAAGLTRQLLAFSRKQCIGPTVLDIHASLHALSPMLQRLIGEDIDIALEAGSAPALSVLDPGQLDQLVMNLALNARDAMPRGGTLRISLEPVARASTCAPRDERGELLRLSVTDTGPGIPPEHLPHIFEPFFTTKTGKGTGLGLATVYGIVQQAGGSIEVESGARGTTFHVFLPRTTAPITQTAEPPPPPVDAPLTGQTILLAEDERAVRALARGVLSTAGFDVLVAENAESALALAQAPERRIDLLVTDIVMPGMSGVALAERIRAIRPDTAVLFMTGYSNDDLLRRGTAMTQARLLDKPFLPADLLAAVHSALETHA